MSVSIRLEKVTSVFSSPVKTFVLHLHASLYLFGLSCICYTGNDDCCPRGTAQPPDNWL